MAYMPLISLDTMQAMKGVQAPGVGKLHREADFLEELGSQKLNSQQRQAVASVLVGAGGGGLPLALFGPPGTGKTVTLVECALQVTYHAYIVIEIIIIIISSIIIVKIIIIIAQ